MFIVSFYKDEENYEVLVWDHTELIQLLNYINEFEYELESVHERFFICGYESFREMIAEEEKDVKFGKKPDTD